MSYDVWLVGSRGRPLAGLDVNYTYNVAPMFFDAVGEGPNQWDGRHASDVAEVCDRILAAFTSRPDHYRAMNPANGWGNFDGAIRFITTIRDACRRRPHSIVRVA